MLLIERNTDNRITLTLTEKTTLSDVAFVFELKRDETGEAKYFTASDESPWPNRYNEFHLTEGATDDSYFPRLELLPGYYTYRVFESEPTSPQDLSESAWGNLLETGKALVINNSAPEPTRYDNSYERNAPVYYNTNDQ